MSNRVHRVLGYALCDLEVNEDDQVVDARLNLKKWESLRSWRELDEYLAEEGSRLSALPAKKRTFSQQQTLRGIEQLKRMADKSVLQHCLQYDAECAKRDTLLLVPPNEYHRWYRYDELIDGYIELARAQREENLAKELQQAAQCASCSVTAKAITDRLLGDADPSSTQFDLLPGGIWPYNTWVDRRNYRQLDSCAVSEVLSFAKKGNLAIATEISRELDMSVEEVCTEARIVPAPGVFALASFLEIFHSENTLLELKPALLTYWG